ncbi:MAG: hypothetical protein E7610_01090 [Ruminococcaceae bacterium]|nr:hypothetical protein [Oscillospiraceae bacterium]
MIMKRMRCTLAVALAALLAVCGVSCQPSAGKGEDTTSAITLPNTAESEKGTESVTDPAEVTTQAVPETTVPETDALPDVDPIEFSYAGAHYTFNGNSAEAAQVTSKGFAYGAAFYEDERLNGDFDAIVHVTPGTLKAEAGLLFGAKVSEDGERFEGYAFTLMKEYIYLYRVFINESGETELTELASHCVGNLRGVTKTGGTLRVVRRGDAFSFYFCDDLEGVEPWPEFEVALTDMQGIGIGYFDNGRGGASFDFFAVTEAASAPAPEQTYLNPVFESADPYVLYHDGVYYCYATSAPVGYYVHTSTDLVNWTYAGLCAEEMWGFKQWYWAPEVIEKDGKFYMIATVNEHIGIAVADSPLGPFIPQENWLYEKSIDGHIFVDDDGRVYLYYVSWQSEYAIYGCELTEDLLSVKPGTTKLMLRAQEPWEKVDGDCVEGPYMLKHNGTYYLTYSGTVYTSDQYAVGYATADSPLGDFERNETNPVLCFNYAVHGPGHHSFATDANGDLWMVYHRHNSTEAIHPRMTCIDRARFAPTASGVDRLEVYGPTSTNQPYPGS